jgi:hypothetical protein
MKRIFFAAILVLVSGVAKADLMFDASVFYNSTNKDSLDYTQKEGHLFIGMPVAVKEQLYLGLNFISADSQTTDGGSTSTEIGPRINYYFNQDKTFLVALAYHPYVKFDQGDLDASSYIAGIGYEMKVNTNFFIGASIVYHSITSTNNTTNVQTTVSTTRPMINFSFRFR